MAEVVFVVPLAVVEVACVATELKLTWLIPPVAEAALEVP